MISVSGLRKSFAAKDGRVVAVDDVTFDVAPGSFFTLVGPSGCGKTTTLRMIAGLETPTSGEIRIGESVVFSDATGILVPAHKRSIGMVFQSYAIWPHMSVFENVAYPLQVHKVERSEIRRRVDEALKMVDLGGLGDRPAPRLSGGQQQRVALARAMVMHPNVLLLDEPLSNLDAGLRMQMREELKSLQSRIGITTIYVTHDQDEALSLSDHVAVMNRGVIVQTGSPVSVYSLPLSRFVATFIGAANLIDGSLDTENIEEGTDALSVATEIGQLSVPSFEDRSFGSDVTVCIRPELIELLPNNEMGENVFTARVVQSAYLGHHIEYTIVVGDTPLRVSGRPADRYVNGATVFVRLPREHCVLIERTDTLQGTAPETAKVNGR